MTQPSLFRILYVEDNPLVSEVTAELLMQDERHIVCVATAEEALREFAQQPFDLVITDISLPAMSGLDLARKILDADAQARIIVASGYALNLNVTAWGPNVRSIVKPFDMAQIDALIAELSGGGAAGD